MVTSIPPHLRAKADNLIVASLWFGQTKPNMNCMLQPILSSIASLEKGISLQQGSSEIIIRAKLIMGIFDLPAKAAATNTKQFNGEYGCFYCLDKGRIHNRARIYPPDDHHHLRKPNQMTQWAEEAEQNQVCTFGVKGYSLLSKFLSFPQSIPLDYMHSVLEGVYKQLMKFWFEPRFHSEPYSLRKHISTINRILARLKPPNEVHRSPRSIENISFYKASEYRAWLLFYSVPVLSIFLPPEYTHHLSLLVSAMHILLSDKILVGDLHNAYSMLSTFYQSAGKLYSPSIYTANMHSLEHIVGLVQLWGPLWAYSMFGFENLNGYLGNKYHGTQKIVYQLSFQIQLCQMLPDKLQELSRFESAETQEYIKKILHRQHKRCNMHQIHPNGYAIGKLSLHALTDKEKEVASLHNISLGTSNVYIFYRLMWCHTIFHCDKRKAKVGSRNNTICSYQTSNGSSGYGQIICFYMPSDALPFCIIKPFQIDEDASPLRKLRPSQYEIIRMLTSQHIISKIIHHVKGDSTEDLVAVPLKNINKKCILINIPLQGQNTTYIISLPNTYEIH